MMNIIKQFKHKTGKIYNFYVKIDNFFALVSKHHLFMLAAGIAFNILIYLIPLFLIAIFIVSLFVSVNEITTSLQRLTAELLPPTEQSSEFLESIINQVQDVIEKSRVFGLIGIFALLWLSSALIKAFRISLNTIFDLPSKGFFIIYRFKDIVLTVILTILILVYSYIIPIVSFILQAIGTIFPSNWQSFLTQILLSLASILSSGVLFYFIYSYVPNRKLNRKVRYWGTLICTVAIEVSRHIFAWYIGSTANYGKFYGTYAIIVSIAVWIYYSALIILMSAELSKYLYGKETTSD